MKLLIEGMGEDAARAGLIDTPRRVADFYGEVLAGMRVKPREIVKPLPADEHDEIVLVKNIAFHSLCEHHLVPFFGTVCVAYIPNKKITGMSSLVRLVETYSRRLQVQERLTTQIADTLMKRLRPRGVMVVIEAEHMCMAMRGVNKPGAKSVTSVVRGGFRTDPRTRQEALTLINGNL